MRWGKELSWFTLRQESGREGRLVAIRPLVFAFVIAQDAQSGGEAQQLVVRQAKLPAPWMPAAQVVVDQKRLVDQHAAWFERLQEGREQRAVEVKETENDVVPFFREVRRRVRIGLQIQVANGQVREVPLPSGRGQLSQRLFVPVYGFNRVPPRREIERVPAAPGGDIQRRSFGQERQLLHEKPRRAGVHDLRGPAPAQAHADRYT